MALYRQEFIICPWCEEESGCRVDHLYGGTNFQRIGPWYCNECRKPIMGKINAPGDVEITKGDDSKRSFSRSMALLKFEGKDGPVFFVMDHDRYRDSSDETDEDNQNHQRYFFEEQSCPKNWLRDCAAVIQDGDCDPHGFLDFVRAVDVPNDFDDDNDQNWALLFPEAFPGPIIDGEIARPVHKLTNMK